MSISQLKRVQRICMALPATIERVSHGEPERLDTGVNEIDADSLRSCPI